jgi:uncharacterized protein YndB with AHSA1/START domain
MAGEPAVQRSAACYIIEIPLLRWLPDDGPGSQLSRSSGLSLARPSLSASAALFRFTPRSPGALAFEPHQGGRFTETLANGTIFEIGRIRVWEPGERLVFGWRQATFRSGQETEVEVTFETVGAGTRVTVIHRGWDSVPDKHVACHGFPDAIFLRRHGMVAGFARAVARTRPLIYLAPIPEARYRSASTTARCRA